MSNGGLWYQRDALTNRTCGIVQVELQLLAAKSSAIDVDTLGPGATLIAAGHTERLATRCLT